MRGRKAYGLGSDAETDPHDDDTALAEQIHDPEIDSPGLPDLPETAYAPDAEPLQVSPAPGRVTLLKPHTHGGIDYAAGDELDVSEQLASWLRQHGVCA